MIIPLLILDYEIRKEYIIQYYCINKDKPELHCDGKCYLAKKIDAAEKKDEKQATSRFLNQIFSIETLNIENETFYVPELFVFLIKNTDNFYYELSVTKDPILSILKPPKV